jgi:hypothetical protein
MLLIKFHVTSLYNLTDGLVIDYASVRIRGITNKDTLKSFTLKFRQSNTFLQKEKLITKYLKVLDIGLVAGNNL